jgi:hypothetical protein
MAKMNLDELTRQLREALGAGLHAVVLYGSAAARDASGTTGSFDVLVLVDALDIARLDAAAAVVRAWTDAGNPPPMTMTTEEWRSSADIFPMEYADILERHRVLHGELPTDGVRVERSDLRRELENQAMGKLLHLRRGVLACGGNASRQVELLEVSKSAVLVLFRATLRLHGMSPSSDSAAVVRDTARVAGFDAEPFLRVLRHVRKEAKLGRAEVPATLAGYVAGVEQLKRHLDQYSSEHPSLTT